MRRSPLARFVGLMLFVLTRPRFAGVARRIWWVIPLVKVLQFVSGRRRTPVHTVRVKPGDEIRVSLKKAD